MKSEKYNIVFFNFLKSSFQKELMQDEFKTQIRKLHEMITSVKFFKTDSKF